MDNATFKQQILHSAVSANHTNFLELISNISTQDLSWSEIYFAKSGNTTVHLAAQSGSVEIIKYFKENGHQGLLEQRNFDGKTPLHVAAQSGNLQCLKFLLSCSVNVDALKRADWTPLMLACTKDNVKIVDTLISHGANLGIKNKDGWTAFHIAVREGHMNIICCLLRADPLIWKTVSKNSRTPLHTAALNGHLDAVKTLLDVGCDKDAQDACGTTPLMDSASGNHVEILYYLIEKAKVDIQKKDVLGRNALHLAAQSGSLDCMTYLLVSAKMDVDEQTFHGLTALHFAVKEKQAHSMKLLYRWGADPSIKDNRGRSVELYGSKEVCCKEACCN